MNKTGSVDVTLRKMARLFFVVHYEDGEICRVEYNGTDISDIVFEYGSLLHDIESAVEKMNKEDEASWLESVAQDRADRMVYDDN